MKHIDWKFPAFSACLVLSLSAGFVVAAGADIVAPSKLYEQHCAACHGGDRLGSIGPALLPSSLERLKKPAAEKPAAKKPAAKPAAKAAPKKK